LMHQIHHKKIPAGIIQSVDQVFEMEAATRILVEADNLRGVRSFVGTHQHLPLLPPPHFGEHTDMVLQSLGIAGR
ncbi:MAG TPA: hypothetical protein PLJ08_21305, partial [Cyclobacteriaceae bacterium]|nr:hypothetical protein [Cyclobacteriaceae bacterium]